jgi:MFS family permease
MPIRDNSSAPFLGLFTLDACSRALLLTIVPQQAYQLLGSAQLVTLVYLGAGVGGLAASLAVPMALARWGRRQVLTFSVLTNGLGCALLAGGRPDGLVEAVVLQTIANSTSEIVVNLCLLEKVARRELNRFEPLRLLFAGISFVVGPWLGVALHHQVAEGLTYLCVGLLLTIYLFYFLLLTTDGGSLRRANRAAASAISPLGYVRRYAGKPRLVLAWILAIGRYGWWLLYFVYTPIMVARLGYDPEVGGLLVSLGQLPMLAMGLWAMLGRRYGLRHLLVLGYGGCGMATLAVGTTMGWPVVGMGSICLAALFATMIDGAGNVPFLRAVRPLERSEMTAVYMTYRHVGSLVPSAIYFAVLTIAPLPFVYFTSGLIALAMAGLSLKLPRGL